MECLEGLKKKLNQLTDHNGLIPMLALYTKEEMIPCNLFPVFNNYFP